MNTKTFFQILGVVGFIAILIASLTIPSNPNELVYSITKMTFDSMPLWLAITISGGFIYEAILFSIYDKLENK